MKGFEVGQDKESGNFLARRIAIGPAVLRERVAYACIALAPDLSSQVRFLDADS